MTAQVMIMNQVLEFDAMPMRRRTLTVKKRDQDREEYQQDQSIGHRGLPGVRLLRA